MLYRRSTARQTVLEEADEVQRFLDRFFLARIGIRLLIGQHLDLCEQHQRIQKSGSQTDARCEGQIGEITLETNVSHIVEICAHNAQAIAARHYGMLDHEAPQFVVECDPNLTVPYIASHLSHILFEVRSPLVSLA